MTKRILWAVEAAVLGAGASFAHASADGYLAPPMEPSIDWWVLLYFVVGCAGIAVVAFKSAKRTHLD